MSDQPDRIPGFPPKMTLCVGAVVLHDDRVLFVRQTYGDSLTNTWTLPWGFAHDGDDCSQPAPPHEAALRETLEESGITAEVEGLLGIQNHTSRAGEPRLYLLFLCRHASGEPTPDGHETDKAAYLSLADLDALDERVDPFCDWLARRVLRGEHHLIPPEAANPYRPHTAFF
ncbi:MAG: NUDIX domain-containing protein [Anaerolineae bacterium]|jgi:ADP-ribose pyrophosphatase YjhB (NUDIX family)|nr:NUDIX domain-containing protein [Anaerolineae bacterium]